MVSQAFIAASTGTAVEFFETVAIAYAILRAGYPKEAISALIVGHLLIFTLAIFISPAHQLLPIFWFRIIAATMLTMMGLYWSIKSIHRIRLGQRPRWVSDPLGDLPVSPSGAKTTGFSVFVFLVMGKSSVIEASEILLIVFPVAVANAAWKEVIWGIAFGIGTVSILAFALHGQLKKIPEVKLKLGIGIVLFVIGISWLLEIYDANIT